MAWADHPLAVIGVLRAPEIVVAVAAEGAAGSSVGCWRCRLDRVGAEVAEVGRFVVGASVGFVGCAHSLSLSPSGPGEAERAQRESDNPIWIITRNFYPAACGTTGYGSTALCGPFYFDAWTAVRQDLSRPASCDSPSQLRLRRLRVRIGVVLLHHLAEQLVVRLTASLGGSEQFAGFTGARNAGFGYV